MLLTIEGPDTSAEENFDEIIKQMKQNEN